MGDRGVSVRGVVKLFGEEAEPRSTVADDLAPRLDPDGDRRIVALMQHASRAVAFGHLAAGVVVHVTRHSPEDPLRGHVAEPGIPGNSESVALDLGDRFGLDGNAGTVQFFGINDQFTAQYVSRVLGEQTIYVTSRSTSTSERSSSVSVSSSERGRPLLTPDEVRRLPENQQIVLMQGQPGLLAEKLRYYADPEFAGLFDENPLHG